MMNQDKQTELQAFALKVRERIIPMATEGGCFLGASLSAVDVLTYLYTSFLNIDKSNLDDPKRDYLFLSKGHDVPALYGIFAELGWIASDRLSNHLSTSDSIYWHPNRQIPGVEFHSGSLGQLPAVSIGVAMDMKISKTANRVVCVMGDGELNEGSCWEAFLVANAHKLTNLIFVIDRNQFQANMATEDLIPLEPLVDKFVAFGMHTQRVNGHDFVQLAEAFEQTNQVPGPHVIICDTVRGKGLPSIEARSDRWFCNFSAGEIQSLMDELHQISLATLTAETLVVR
jgi:transketolase